MLNLCWTILGLPLAAALFIFAVLIPLEKRSASKNSFRTLSAFLSVAAIAVSFVLSGTVLKAYLSAEQGGTFESSLPWLNFAGTQLEIGLLLNGMTVLMLLIVTGVASLVALFSARYMQGEEGYSRYFAAFSFFVFSMLGIVLSNNLIQIFIFWELVGVSSYLLIGFWFEKPSASIAAKKAFLTTRVGDAGMILGILLLFGLLAKFDAQTFNFLELRTRLPQVNLPAGLFALACFGIFLGAVGKSAQVPLHVWLPDAMEGPTPASALIHAATMVAAGVFMVARLFFLFEMSPVVLSVIAWTGVITAFIAASIAVVQDDIKKVLAYSTLSQLGYMMMAAGAGNPEAGMFHLTTHAFFKALLFLGAGSLIHAAHTQNIWEFKGQGSYFKKMPVTAVTFLIGTAALAGLPFTSGFFSKEEILGAASGSRAIFWIALSVVFLTAFYMGRTVTIIFFGSAAAKKAKRNDLHEDNWLVTLPLLVLGAMSIAAGYIPFKELLGGHAGTAHHPHWLPAVSVGLASAGLLAAFFLYRGKDRESHLAVMQAPVKLLQEKYFFDRFYDWLIASAQENIARLAAWFEKSCITPAADFLGGLAKFAGKGIRAMQTGLIQSYALIFALGWTLLAVWLVTRSAS